MCIRALKYILIRLMLLPNVNVEKFATVLEPQLQKYSSYKPSQSGNKKAMITELLKLYQHIVPLLSDAQIVEILRKMPIESIVMSPPQSVEEQNVLIQILRLVNSIIKTCALRRDLGNKIIKRFKDDLKVYFPSRLIEKLFANVLDNFVKTKMLNDSSLV